MITEEVLNDIQQRQPQPQRQVASAQAPQKKKFIRKTNKMIYAAIAVLIILLIGLLVWRNCLGGNGVKKDQYQAVFMVDGQAYIGKLQNNPKSAYLRLTDVYTIQVQSGEVTDVAKDEKSAAQQPSLVKLTDQLAGAEDEIYLSRNQVSFWENLRDDGKVVEAIKSTKK